MQIQPWNPRNESALVRFLPGTSPADESTLNFKGGQLHWLLHRPACPQLAIDCNDLAI